MTTLPVYIGEPVTLISRDTAELIKFGHKLHLELREALAYLPKKNKLERLTTVFTNRALYSAYAKCYQQGTPSWNEFVDAMVDQQLSKFYHTDQPDFSEYTFF